jgi:thioredoxin-like negative regulator of GroEL
VTPECLYTRGVAALLTGDEDAAIRALRAAVAADPELGRAHAALAVALRTTGDAAGAADALSRAQGQALLPRRDRHHLAVITMILTGDLPRASALAQEHLAEFPDDDIVRLVLARWAAVS